MKPKTTIIKNQITQIKADYSHITSRLFSSQSKSKSKQRSLYHSKQLIKTVRQSKQKIQEMGEQKYKAAMKHMNKFNRYEEQKKKKKIQENLKVDAQCTFKPKVNNNKNYPQLSSKFMSSSSLHLLQKPKSILGVNPEKVQAGQKIKEKHINNFTKSDKKPKQIQTAQRLNKWGNNRDTKLISKTIQIQISKSVSKDSSYSSRNKGSSISKQKSYNKFHMKKLNLNLSTVINQSQEKYHNLNYLSTKNTPKGDKFDIPLTGRSTASLLYNNNNSATMTPKSNTMKIQFTKRDRNINDINTATSTQTPRKTQRVYTQIGQNQVYPTYGQKLLAKQADRGQGSFYLRQARANIMKNYQKSDLLIKDKQYTKRFSIFNSTHSGIRNQVEN